jgi:hypothetical protein
MTTMEPDIYYDPYDFEIDSDPYPVWKRLRDERPLYYNERYDFYALSRFDDVDRCSIDWETYISSKGTVLELIKSGMELPPGSIIFEDPPAHNIHRRLLSRVFTPRNINALEPKVREFCARSLDPWWARGASTSSLTSVPRCPCAPSACCSVSPSRTRRPSVTASTRACASTEAPCPTSTAMFGRGSEPGERLRGVHRLAGRPPVRRPDDRPPPGRVRGRDGRPPGLSRQEVLNAT